MVIRALLATHGALTVLALCACCLSPRRCEAAPIQPPAAQTTSVRETRLPDGLVVLTKEVHAAPVVCTYVWYRVGSRDERPPTTGISHQVEHMMFKGTRKEFPHPGYIDLLVGRYGGENNAGTDTDWTSYFLLLPSDQLDLALRIESDRMTNAAMDPAQLAAENRVVLSELQGDENDNAYFLYENVRAAAFQYHPYHFPVIGTTFDVTHFTRDEVYDYYRNHYAPNNATLVIVGDFDTDRTLARVRALWRNEKARSISARQIDPEPTQRGERRVVVRRAGSTAYLETMFHIPAATHQDIPALTVLATVLADGRSSRLYRALVDSQLATDVSASANLGLDPEVFDISVSARAGVDPHTIEKPLLAELRNVRSGTLEALELQKAKNQARADFVYAQDSVQDQAGRLGFFQAVTGDWRNAALFLAHISAVTAADVRRVAQTYLTADNRTMGMFIPNGETPSPAADMGAGRVTHYRPERSARLVAASDPADPRDPGSGPASRSLHYDRPDALARSVGALRPAHDKAARPEMRKLANGLTVIVDENHANRTVSMSGFIRAGSVSDPPSRYGLAWVTAQMLGRGTRHRTFQQIAEELDFVGAHYDVSAGRERTDLAAQMLSEDFGQVLDVIADTLSDPVFPETELSKVKGDTISSLQDEAQDTGTVAARRLMSELYPASDPYEHPVDGTIADVQAITRDDVARFYAEEYRPDRTTLVFVGDVTADAVFTAVQRALGGWTASAPALPAYTPVEVSPPPAPPPVNVVLPDKVQDDIAMGQIGISRTAPDYEAASLMNLLLGGDQFVGRVGKRVRDTEGLAYYAYTGFVAGLTAGPWVFRAGANPRNVAHAITSARDEVTKMYDHGVSSAELAWAQDHLVGARGIGQSTNAGLGAELANDAFYGLGLDYPERYPAIVRALTLSQVDAAARKYLHPTSLAVVVAGPPVAGLEPSPAAGSQKQ